MFPGTRSLKLDSAECNEYCFFLRMKFARVVIAELQKQRNVGIIMEDCKIFMGNLNLEH